MSGEKPLDERDVRFSMGCFGLLLVGALSIGLAVALGYGAQWLLGL